jgi:LysM repeat protein
MRFRTLLLSLVLCLACSAWAQEIRTVGGEKYIVHTVEKGQTLFGISKHYAVPVNAITDANPGAEQGLSVGQVLLIPRKEQSKKELKTAPQLSDGELLYTVSKKETLFGISRKFGVTPEDLRRWNPDLQYGLQPGMVLHVQVAKSTAAPPVAVQPAVADNAQFHQVQQGETMYALSRTFGVPASAIEAANGGLPEGLKTGMYIRIPAKGLDSSDTIPVREAPKAAPSIHRKIAVLLPFTAQPNDTTPATDEGGRQTSVTDAAIEFRAGLGLALDTLQAMGLNADVQVFDTGMKPEQWNPLMKSDALRGMDLYIGPFHRGAVEALARVSGSAPIICPVPQSNKVLLGHPTVSKAVGSRADRIKLMSRYIAVKHAKDNIILVKPDIFSERDLARTLENELKTQLGPQTGKLRDSLLVVTCQRRDVSAAVGKLDANRANILVVPSEDVEFVTTVLNKLSGLVPKYSITVYGLNAWMDMATLDISALVKLNVHVPANDYINRNAPAVIDFIARYRARYHNEPGEYAFLGYDVALYFISAEMQYGGNFPQQYAQVQASPVHMDFRMQKLGPENGWNNSSAVMLEYQQDGIRKAQ